MGLLSRINSGKRADRRAKEQTNKIFKTAKKFEEQDLAKYQGEFDVMSQYGDMFKGLADGYGKESEKAYLDTTEGKSFLGSVRDQSRNSRKQWGNANNLNGGSMESLLAGMNSVNQGEASQISNLVAGSDSRRNNLRNMQLTSLSRALGANQDRFTAMQGTQYNARNFAAGIYGQQLGNAYQFEANRQAASAEAKKTAVTAGIGLASGGGG